MSVTDCDRSLCVLRRELDHLHAKASGMGRLSPKRLRAIQELRALIDELEAIRDTNEKPPF